MEPAPKEANMHQASSKGLNAVLLPAATTLEGAFPLPPCWKRREMHRPFQAVLSTGELTLGGSHCLTTSRARMNLAAVSPGNRLKNNAKKQKNEHSWGHLGPRMSPTWSQMVPKTIPTSCQNGAVFDVGRKHGFATSPIRNLCF